jgi:hypothetical protein
LSPEKAVIWMILHGDIPCGVSREHFTHPMYRYCFDAVSGHFAKSAIRVSDITDILASRGHRVNRAEQRVLKRLIRIRPPARIRHNIHVLAQALINRYEGIPVHIERLIN